ncbi:MAG: protein kinase [Candidatus Melainabacteria bacterium]|nr:protein kinase [Candidatus Melainabacteria bacterium]
MANRSSEEDAKSPGSDLPETTAILESAVQPGGDTTTALAMQRPVVLSPGSTVLEKFKIIGLLGQGGMGSVYRVEHLLMNRQFALKCLNKYQAADAGWKRFQNEAKAAHMLDHANLLKVYEFGLLPGGQPFFLMELVEGVTLADEIRRLGHLPVERAIKIFIQVAFAIGYAHECRVVHRDLKPSNIMLVGKKSDTDLEVVKVLDFGIAKLTGVDEVNQQTLTKTGEIFGSPLYMSPEQCMGVAVDHRSDLYSLGCVFYEALTSAPPFMGETALSTMMKHQSENQTTLKEASLGMHFPPALEHVISKLLEKDPHNRYQSASQLASDLIRIERGLNEGDDQSQTSSRADSPATPSRRKMLQRAEQADLLTSRTVALLSVGVITFGFGFVTSYLTAPHFKPAEAPKPSIEEKVIPPSDPFVHQNRDWSTIRGDSRFFDFPGNSSLGKIVVADGETHEATGTFSVPKALALGLVVNENLIRHPEYLDKFKPGEIVVVDFNTVKDTPQAIFEKVSTMTELKGLNLYNTEFSDRDAHMLSKLTKLLYLNLGFTGVNCKEALKYAPLKNLNCLDLTCVKDGKLAIEKLPEMLQLRHILFVKCELQDDDLKQIAKNDRIKILDVAWNDITDIGVEHLSRMKNLEYLDLSETELSPEVWKSLIKMPKLRKVKLAKCMGSYWSLQTRRYFEAMMAKHAPNVGINWVYADNLDFIVASTDLTFLGQGMRAHACPLFSAIKSGALMGTSP